MTRPSSPGVTTQPAASKRSPLDVRPPDEGSLGVVLHGLDPASLDEARVREVRELVWREKLVVLRDLELSDAAYVDLGHRMGRVRPYFQDHYHHPEHPEIFVSSNVPHDGQKVGVAGTGRMWHTDYSFFDDPLSMTMVRPRIIPEASRGTHYIDMVQVLAELPADLRAAVEGKRCFHDAVQYYKVQPWDIDRAICELMEEFHREAPGAWHPAIQTHPVTGETYLYVSRGFTTKVEGLKYEENRELLDRLFAFIEEERFIRTQPWRMGDILFWDNRSLIHHATSIASGMQSESHRISLNDGQPFYVGHEGALGYAGQEGAPGS